MKKISICVLFLVLFCDVLFSSVAIVEKSNDLNGLPEVYIIDFEGILYPDEKDCGLQIILMPSSDISSQPRLFFMLYEHEEEPRLVDFKGDRFGSVSILMESVDPLYQRNVYKVLLPTIAPSGDYLGLGSKADYDYFLSILEMNDGKMKIQINDTYSDKSYFYQFECDFPLIERYLNQIKEEYYER